MKDSVVLEWLDENRRRAFPLTESAGGPPTDIIVDAQLLMSSSVTPSLVNIIVVAGVSCVINISEGQSFSIVLPISTDYITVTNNSNSKVTVSSAVNSLITGTTNYVDVYFEDYVSLCISGKFFGVTSVAFTAFAEDLGLLDGYYLQLMSGDTLGLIAGNVPFVGDIDFYGRYQTKLDVKNGSLLWVVGKNHGTPLPACAPYGADDCGTQVSYINGVSPVSNAFTFKTGAGIKVTPDKINHTLTFELDFATTDICATIPPTP